MGLTPRKNINYPELPDSAWVPRDAKVLALAIDAAADYDQGALDDRPVSSVAVPGRIGRLWWATDAEVLSVDLGTSWADIGPGVYKNNSILDAHVAVAAAIQMSKINVPICRLVVPTEINCLNGNITTIPWTMVHAGLDGQEQFDTAGMFDEVAQNTRVTIQKSGVYNVKGELQFKPDTPAGATYVGPRIVHMYLNGVQTFSALTRAVTDDNTSAQFDWMVKLSADRGAGHTKDFIQIKAQHNAGVSLRVDDFVSWLSVRQVAQTP